MSRYVNRQQHSATCGPIAAINVLKYLGYKAPFREYLPLFESLGYTPKEGTNLRCMSIFLNYFDVKYKRKPRKQPFHPSKFFKALERNPVVLCYDHKPWDYHLSIGGHFAFVECLVDDLVMSHNAYDVNFKEDIARLRNNSRHIADKHSSWDYWEILSKPI